MMVVVVVVEEMRILMNEEFCFWSSPFLTC